MDRCPLCGKDPANHAEHCPDALWAKSNSVFVDPDEVARGRAALERDHPTEAVTVIDASGPGDPATGDLGTGDLGTGDLATVDLGTGDLESDLAGTGEGSSAVPWAIPIREPAVVSTRAARRPVDAEQRRLVGLVVGGVALLVVALIGASLIGRGSGAEPTTEVAGSEVSRPPEQSSTTAAAPAVAATPVDSSTSVATAPPETEAPTTAPTTAAPVSDDTGDVPILAPGDIGRGWVAQVSSVPQRSGGQALQRAFATVSRSAPSAVAIRSDQWPSMQSGFWVIVVPGFDTGADALDACASAGSGDCFGRYLSAIADQNDRTCRRVDGGGRVGDCGA